MEQEVEWVFLRSERFLPSSTISGDWVSSPQLGEATIRRSLRPDGTVGGASGNRDEETYRGHYRVWRTAQNELMVTTVLWVQGEGAFATFERIELRDATMMSSARVPPGFGEKAPEVWRRVGEAAMPGR